MSYLIFTTPFATRASQYWNEHEHRWTYNASKATLYISEEAVRYAMLEAERTTQLQVCFTQTKKEPS